MISKIPFRFFEIELRTATLILLWLYMFTFACTISFSVFVDPENCVFISTNKTHDDEAKPYKIFPADYFICQLMGIVTFTLALRGVYQKTAFYMVPLFIYFAVMTVSWIIALLSILIHLSFQKLEIGRIPSFPIWFLMINYIFTTSSYICYCYYVKLKNEVRPHIIRFQPSKNSVTLDSNQIDQLPSIYRGIPGY